MFSSLVNRLLKRPSPVSLEPARSVKRKCSSQSIFKPLVWIDCEMTGLDISKDHIIEICCIITDGNLNIIDEKGYESTVYVPKKVLDNMNEWCVTHHGESGLTAKILANPQQTLAKVQQELLEYIQSFISEPRTSLLAGNSVHMDKFFMMKEFPQVIEHLHYRLVDVSSIMEVGYRHNPNLMKLCPKKKGSHTARSDILESIEQLRWYRNNYLRGDIPQSLSTGGLPTEPESKKPKISPKTEEANIAVENEESVSENKQQNSELADNAEPPKTISEVSEIVVEVTQDETANEPALEEKIDSEPSKEHAIEVIEETIVVTSPVTVAETTQKQEL